MALKRILLGRLIFVGIIWIPTYAVLASLLGSLIFGFSPLNKAHWLSKISAFQNGWVISTPKDWAWLIYILLLIPVCLIGWWKCYRTRWHRLFQPIREKKVQHQSVQMATTKKVFEPQKLRVQSSAIYSTPVASSPAPVEGPSPEYTPVANAPIPQQPTNYEDEASVQQALAMTAGIQADFFPHVNLDGAYASFALSTEKRAAVFCIINRPDSTWAVDTEVDIAESDWFYESGILKTPAKDILAISQNLQSHEPDSLSIPVILLMGGTLLNQEEVLAYLDKHHVMLVRSDNVMADSVPLFTDFLKEYFSPTSPSEEK